MLQAKRCCTLANQRTKTRDRSCDKNLDVYRLKPRSRTTTKIKQSIVLELYEAFLTSHIARCPNTTFQEETGYFPEQKHVPQLNSFAFETAFTNPASSSSHLLEQMSPQMGFAMQCGRTKHDQNPSRIENPSLSRTGFLHLTKFLYS